MTVGGQQDRRRVIDMSCLPPRRDISKTIAVIGGGFSGSLFALKLNALKPEWTILLVETDTRVGCGLAYGACGPQHLLNVPVARMEVGLEPSFADWLSQRPGQLQEALEESGGSLPDAFVPRQLFGDYLEQHVAGALTRGDGGGIRRIHGEVMAISPSPQRLMLDDGRALEADAMVLATGNQPPGLPFRAAPSTRIVADPWSPGALDGVTRDTPLLLVGTGLTMVDVVLALRARGHEAPIHAVSRHGLLPFSHRPGGSWRSVLQPGVTPKEALRTLRAHAGEAQAQGVPWQRVFDAVRPAVASVWHAWTVRQRGQFLRHLRAIWDVHRHRMAARAGALIGEMVANGGLLLMAGRILAVSEDREGIVAVVRPRGGRTRLVEAGVVINCTGPQIDLRKTEHPLFKTLQRQRLIHSDSLGLGLETEDCAVKAPDGSVSSWLYALGSLTRPAWWEIVAVPEINAQMDRLVRKITNEEETVAAQLPALFLDIGAGI
jgi:uncharacterized NAD(P)/FAD-binding protein YdhS